jgi:transcriptional regulator with XRE-family HTH domain
MTLAVTDDARFVVCVPMEEPAAIPDRHIVQARRKALKLSLEKLADRLSLLCGTEIKWQSVQQFENGKNKNPRFLWQLAKALTTTDEYLSGRTTDPKIQGSLTTLEVGSMKAPKGATDREGQPLSDPLAHRLIGRLEARIEALESRLAELDQEPSGTSRRHPRGGTRGR